MKIIKKSSKDYLIKTYTFSNRDFGIFLLFLGIVATFPVYYIALIALNSPSKNLQPALWISLALILTGIYLIWGSVKYIYVNPQKITISDGLFQKTISYPILPDEEKFIKIKSYEIEYRAAPLEIWQVYLASGHHEYLVETRPNQQLEVRQLGETLAKIINCPLEDTTFETGTLTISPSDLDSPFKEKVLKYPELLGKPVKEPSKLYFKTQKDNSNLTLSWGIVSSRMLLETSLFFISLLILSFLPIQKQSSIYQQCASSHNFLFYNTLGIIIAASFLVLVGYKAKLMLKTKSIEFKETLWGIPYKISYIPLNKIEEIGLYSGMRGVKVQINSDKKIIQIRTYNKENARWLAFIIRRHATEIK